MMLYITRIYQWYILCTQLVVNIIVIYVLNVFLKAWINTDMCLFGTKCASAIKINQTIDETKYISCDIKNELKHTNNFHSLFKFQLKKCLFPFSNTIKWEINLKARIFNEIKRVNHTKKSCCLLERQGRCK